MINALRYKALAARTTGPLLGMLALVCLLLGPLLLSSPAPQVVNATCSYSAVWNTPPANNLIRGRQLADNYLNSVTQQGLLRWSDAKLPLRVYVAPGNGVAGYRPQFRQMVFEAFDTWARVTNNRLSWREVSNPNGADVVVRWTTQLAVSRQGFEAGRTETITAINTRTGKGTIGGSRVSLLTRLGNRTFSDQEMQRVAIHEVGHVFGLQGHSPHPGDIMFFATSPGQMPVLSSRDVNTINMLYNNDFDAPTVANDFGNGYYSPSDSSPAYAAGGYYPSNRSQGDAYGGYDGRSHRMAESFNRNGGDGYRSPRMGRTAMRALINEAARRMLERRYGGNGSGGYGAGGYGYDY